MLHEVIQWHGYVTSHPWLDAALDVVMLGCLAWLVGEPCSGAAAASTRWQLHPFVGSGPLSLGWQPPLAIPTAL